jgi:hypothetical protein
MLLRYGLSLPEAAQTIERAIAAALTAGARTADTAMAGEVGLTTCDFTDQVIRRLQPGALRESSLAPS